MSCLSTKEEFLFSVCKAQTKRKLSKNENAEEVILDRINAPGKKQQNFNHFLLHSKSITC